MLNGIHPTYQEIVQAHNLFLNYEPRDLFYRLATNLIQSALDQVGLFSITEAVSVLLQTWNNNHYRYHHFDANHYILIEQLINNNLDRILQFRNRNISTIANADKDSIINLFTSFQDILKPVGAAKALHLLCPNFFPIWDNKIAIAYNLRLISVDTNPNKYLSFVYIQQNQAAQLPEELPNGISKLKAIDEYNYCRYTKCLM